jgi:hypothetical protein
MPLAQSHPWQPMPLREEDNVTDQEVQNVTPGSVRVALCHVGWSGGRGLSILFSKQRLNSVCW